MGVVHECHLLCFLNQGLSLSWNTPSRLGQLPRRFLSHHPRITTKSHLTQLLHMVSVNQIHALMLFTDQVFSLVKKVTFLNNGHLFVYVVTFIYLFCPFMWYYSNVPKRSLTRNNVTQIIHCIIELGFCFSCVIFYFCLFIYLLFLLFLNMATYSLVEAGQRKSERG